MRFLENKSEKIVKWIFIGIMIYFIGNILMGLAIPSTANSNIGYYITLGILYFGGFCKLIGQLLVFKFLVDVLYKILKALDKYTNEQS